MTNREENLKKLNDELEKLSDKELDQVSGGTCGQTAEDSKFLNSLGGFTNRYSEWEIKHGNHDAEIRDAWAKVGVDATMHGKIFLTDNIYKINGKVVRRIDAIVYAMGQTHNQMEWGSWNW